MNVSLLNGPIMPSLYPFIEFVLVATSIMLFFAFISMGYDAVARRVDLVMPQLKVSGLLARSAIQDQSTALETSQGSFGETLRHVKRSLPKFRIPPSLAYFASITGRLFAAICLGLFAMTVAQHIPLFAGSFTIPPLLAACAAAAGWLLPSMLRRMRAARHAEVVSNGLPEALDLVVVCLDAGLSLEAALGRVVEEIRPALPELAEELALTAADLQILPSRDEALQKMAKRVDIPSVRAFVSTMIQTLRYGTPLAQTLRTIAAEMRNDALMKLEERANRLPAILTVPMIIFIMPTIFLVIGGPAVLRLIDMMYR
jgi:tight adherence protein C